MAADLFELFLLHVVVLAVDDHLAVDEDDVEFEGVHHLDLTTLLLTDDGSKHFLRLPVLHLEPGNCKPEVPAKDLKVLFDWSSVGF